MSDVLPINPSLHGESVQRCLEAHISGNHAQALTLAMSAGVDAGVMGLLLSDCPFKKPTLLDYQIQWNWGRAQSMKMNDNAKQRSLL